jgi:replicative DNA helicase
MVLNSEYNLLGIVLNNPDMFHRIKKNIFLNKKCFELYEIIDIEIQKNKGFTKEILLDTLKSNKVLTEEDFYEIYDFGYDSLNFDLYFNFVLNKWALHKADLLIKDIRKQNIKTTVDLQNELQKIIKEIAVDEENISDSQEIILKIIDDLNNNVNVNLIRSNIKYIDSYGGFEKGDFVIIAARPAIGKSSLVYNLILRDMQQGEKSGMFSLEAGKNKIFRIIGCIASGIDSNELRNNRLQDEDKRNIIESFNKIYENRIKIDDKSKDIETIKRKIKYMVDNFGINKIYIDYLGLIESQEGNTRYEKVTHMSREIKKIAMDLGIVIIALHQLNRESENRIDKKPRQHDLRDSGTIEQDADIIILLSRLIFDFNDSEEILILDFTKTREFPIGEARCTFHKPTRRIKDWIN